MANSSKPASLKEISGVWWELLFSGPLFRVTMSDIPTERHLTFRETCLRTALRLERRASVRFRENLKYAYVQGAPASSYMPAERSPISDAIEMIPPMAGPSRGIKPAKFDIGAVIERLLTAQAGPSVPATALMDHPEFIQYVQECTCISANFRMHLPACPSYSWLPLLERTLNRTQESPEDWYLRRQGIQPTPPTSPTPQAPEADPWAAVAPAPATPPDPWGGPGSVITAPYPKPPAVVWDTKSPVVFQDPQS